MGENTKIEWADHTFNPWMGCTKVSEGCRNCYSENQMDHRWNRVQWGPGKARVRTSEAMWKKPLVWNRKAEKDGTRPRVFCASLADWLDPEVPVEWLADLLALVQATPHLDWLLLTKRPEFWRQRVGLALEYEFYDNPSREACERVRFAGEWYEELIAPANVWLGCTVENQKATARIPNLLSIPARVRFLSCEPLLGPLNLNAVERPDDAYMKAQGHTGVITSIDEPDDYLYWQKMGIHWIICGGESGQSARPMHPDWARSLRDQCQTAGIPFHFKQWGEWQAVYDRDIDDPDWRVCASTREAFPKGRWLNLAGGQGFHGDRVHWMAPVGKKAAGRLLDGREWNEFPQVAAI